MKFKQERENMKKFLALIVGLTIAHAASAIELSISDADYVGSINDCIPSSLAEEASYINYLITLSAGDADIQIPAGTGETYNRVGSTLAGPFPTALEVGAVKSPDFNDGDDPTFSASSGFVYVLAKYDATKAGGLVWYIDGGVSSVTVPSTFNGKYLSHISLFNPGGSVPDGGTTVTLLGFGLLALGGLRRRFAK